MVENQMSSKIQFQFQFQIRKETISKILRVEKNMRANYLRVLKGNGMELKVNILELFKKKIKKMLI
jgi:hypothetical protein